MPIRTEKVTTMTVEAALPRGWRHAPKAAEATLEALRAAYIQQHPAPTFDSPGDLAKALDPTTVQTPALDLIDDLLMRVAKGLVTRAIITMPPQEGKSQRVSHYGALWLLKQNPALRMVIVSYGDQIASNFTYQIKNDIQTFNGTQGGLDLGLHLRKDSKAASRWQLAYPHTGSMYATGIAGSLTSIPVDLMLIDDPVKDARAADSILQSESTWEWWQSVARPRLAPRAPVIIILTRWSETDIAGRLIAKQKQDAIDGEEDYDKWEILNIPAQADFKPEEGETDPLGREPGEFMHSARGRTAGDWRATKAAMSSRLWSALYQGRPTPDAGDVWKRNWWRIYDTPIWHLQDFTASKPVYLVDEYDDMIQSWDMTFKDDKGSDFVVGQVWVRRGATAYLVDQIRRRLTFTETVKAFEELTARWPQCGAKLVEDKANGTAVIETLKRKIPGIIGVNPTESKYARASAVSPFIEAGGGHLPADGIALFEVDEFIEETSTFPNGAHDDQVDSTSQALARFFVGNALISEWLADMRAHNEAREEAVLVELVKPGDELMDPITEARNKAFRASQRR